MLASVVALTWLNPHVYLDTVLLVGSLANQHGATGAGGSRSAPASRARLVHGLGYGARLLRRSSPAPRLAGARPRHRLLMLAIAAQLALG